MSIKIKQADEIEKILCHKFTRFMMVRAENFFVLRRKPIEVRGGRPRWTRGNEDGRGPALNVGSVRHTGNASFHLARATTSAS